MPERQIPARLETWLKPYLPIKRVPIGFIGKLTSGTCETLLIENTPQFTYFSTYGYLDPKDKKNWPWDVGNEIPEVSDLDQLYLLGVQVLYQQEWIPQGYGLGELLHSITLAPGEETTIEILTWDRNTYKLDEEMTSDLERQVEQNRQFKDSQEVQNEIKETKKWNVGGSVGLSIGGIFKFGADGGYSNQTESLDRTTRNNIVEVTDKASSKLHNSRKTSISSTREFGTEQKVTRKITNTNRCHTVTYHYYEVLRNYKVQTRLASPSARPCIFIKQTPPIAGPALLVEPSDYSKFLQTLQWLYHNSHILARGLLDRSFYRGLEVLPDILAYWTMRRGVPVLPKDDWDRLIAPYAQTVVTQFWDTWNCMGNFSLWGIRSYLGQILFKYPWYRESINQLNTALKEWQGVNAERLQSGIEAFIQEWRDKYPTLAQSDRDLLESSNGRQYLYDGVIRLESEYLKLTYGPAPGEEPTPEHLDRMKNVAEVTRLLRHIEQNRLHYFQLIWVSANASQRLLEASNLNLPGGKRLADVFEPNLLGFYADYAVFPFTGGTEGAALGELLKEIEALESKPPVESEVVLPTNGIHMEPQVGQCTACEDFIEQHRQYDLQSKAFEVQKAELENQRRREKIQNCELDNPDCCPSNKYGLLSRILCRIHKAFRD